jgi:hypothetical protein
MDVFVPHGFEALNVLNPLILDGVKEAGIRDDLIMATGRSDFPNLDIKLRIAMLSFSNFGSTRHPTTEKVASAVQIVRKRRPDLKIGGEMQADIAVVPDILNEVYDFNERGSESTRNKSKLRRIILA